MADGVQIGAEEAGVKTGFDEAKRNILHVKEAYQKEDQVVLSQVQSHQIVDLVIDNPWVSEDEKDEFQRRSNYFFSNHKKLHEPVLGEGDYILRPDKGGVVDLLYSLQDPDLVPKDEDATISSVPVKESDNSPEAVRQTIHKRINFRGGFLERMKRNQDKKTKPQHILDMDDAVYRIEKNTDFKILGKEIMDNPEVAPPELQYALGMAGPEVIQMIKERLQKGDKLALMQISKLPPEVHKSLQIVVQSMHNSVGAAMAYILDEKAEHLQNVDPARRPAVEAAAQVAREGSRKLNHFKLITDEPNDNQAEQIDQEINNILDGNIDVPYAYWKYRVSSFKEDVQMAAGSLGLGTGVALGLMAVGFGGDSKEFTQMIKEGILEGIPATLADTSMNFSAAYSESEKGKASLERTKQTFKLLADKYKFAIGVGVACSVGLGIVSKLTENSLDSHLAAALPLALTSVLPTWVTKWSTDRIKSARDQSHPQEKHPIHDSLMKSSLAAAGATLGVGAARLLDSAPAVTAATELVEPLMILYQAKKDLDRSKKVYLQNMSSNQNVYLEAMNTEKDMLPEVKNEVVQAA